MTFLTSVKIKEKTKTTEKILKIISKVFITLFTI